MTGGYKTIWSILDMEETTDRKKIRHRYAVLSKSCHPEKEPEKFQQLHQAYQQALKWAKTNEKQEEETGQKQEEDSWFEHFTFREEQDVEERTEPAETDVFFSGILSGEKWESEESEENISSEVFFSGMYEIVLQQMTSVEQDGLVSFQNYFESSGEKDWKMYMTTPEFLRAQYEEAFMWQLAQYLKTKAKELSGALSYSLVKELYFSYYPLFEREMGEVFDSGLGALFQVLFQQKDIQAIIKLYEEPSVKSEVIKYRAYYKLFCAIKKNGANQREKEWEVSLVDLARTTFIENGIVSHREKHVFVLLAFLIEEAPVLPDGIYQLLIEKFNLFRLDGSLEVEEKKPLYQAILAKCSNMELFQQKKLDEKAERRQLMEEMQIWYYSVLTEEDRPRLRQYFNSGLFYTYHLDSWFLDYRMLVFALEYKCFPKIFLEEYLAFYHKIYEETGSDVGRELYQLFSEYLMECDVKEEYPEVDENQKEWILQYFFEESLTRVWKSSSKAGMKSVYKSIIMDHFEAIADKKNYEWDLWSEGHLKAEKSGAYYIFSYDTRKEQVTLPLTEYFQIVEEMLEIYMGRYFMSSIEKRTVNEQKERAKEVAYGNHRN